MADYTIRTTRLTICERGDWLHSAENTHVSIEDECAGEFIALEQSSDNTTADADRVTINPAEWPVFCEAVGILLAEIEKHEKAQEDTANG